MNFHAVSKRVINEESRLSLMRVILCLMMLALAGCTSNAPAQTDSEAPAEASDATAPEAPAQAEEVPAEPAPVALATVACPLEDIAVYAGGLGVRGVTSTRCHFEDIEVPEGAVAFDVTFTWSAEFAEDDLGVRVSDQTQCDASGGDGCSLGEAFGASPVVLSLDASTLQGHSLEDLDIYPVGWAAAPQWDATVTFYA